MIVTVSREFGSGGRELGKRLADELGLAYYDRQLVTEIANSTDLNEGYVSSVLENGGFNNFAFSFAHTIPLSYAATKSATDVLVAQQKLIKAIGEKGDCVIVGRNADAILGGLKTVKLFVYADEQSKLARCRARAAEGENLTDKQYLKKFKEIDAGRSKLHDLLSPYSWGERAGYDIMVNTSHTDIKTIVPSLAKLIKDFNK